LEDLFKIRGTFVTQLAFWFLTLGGILGFLIYRNDHEKKTVFAIALIWFVGGLAAVRLYAGQIFDYYFGFMFPAPFLLYGLVVYLMWQKNVLRLLAVGLTALSVVFFLSNAFYRNPPNKLIDQTEKVADVVIEKSEGKPFNFALISDHNSDHAYKYFLEIKEKQSTELETIITEQLLIVCESKVCSPLGHPIWEIAGFGRVEIVGEWELKDIGIRVFRLTHWPGEPSPAGKPAQKGT
jgi:hypothetical protein